MTLGKRLVNWFRFVSIQSQKWTQTETAEYFGETQPHISNLMNGDFDRFSIDKLGDFQKRLYPSTPLRQAQGNALRAQSLTSLAG
jgi:predicted XRE-type DNA-binding protein